VILCHALLWLVSELFLIYYGHYTLVENSYYEKYQNTPTDYPNVIGYTLPHWYVLQFPGEIILPITCCLGNFVAIFTLPTIKIYRLISKVVYANIHNL